MSAGILKGHMLREKVNRMWYKKECQSKTKLSDIHKGCSKLGENSDFSMVRFFAKTMLSFTSKLEPLEKECLSLRPLPVGIMGGYL